MYSLFTLYPPALSKLTTWIKFNSYHMKTNRTFSKNYFYFVDLLWTFCIHCNLFYSLFPYCFTILKLTEVVLFYSK